jgi:hypothetical protein
VILDRIHPTLPADPNPCGAAWGYLQSRSPFILISLYHLRQASSIPMNFSIVTPAQSQPWKSSIFSLPKKPSRCRGCIPSPASTWPGRSRRISLSIPATSATRSPLGLSAWKWCLPRSSRSRVRGRLGNPALVRAVAPLLPGGAGSQALVPHDVADRPLADRRAVPRVGAGLRV